MEPVTPERLADILRALADPNRLRILGLLAERPRTGTDLVDALGLTAPTVSHHVDKLERAGFVTATRDGQRRRYALDERRLAELARLASAAPTAMSEDPADDRARILRAFFDGDRLRQIPAQRKKRVVVLQHLLERFGPGRDYPEREVNDLLRRAHDDVATLRRELVDYGYMTRDNGVYRVATHLPDRSVQVGQEIPNDEHAWLRDLFRRAAGTLSAQTGDPA